MTRTTKQEQQQQNNNKNNKNCKSKAARQNPEWKAWVRGYKLILVHGALPHSPVFDRGYYDQKLNRGKGLQRGYSPLPQKRGSLADQTATRTWYYEMQSARLVSWEVGKTYIVLHTSIGDLPFVLKLFLVAAQK